MRGGNEQKSLGGSVIGWLSIFGVGCLAISVAAYLLGIFISPVLFLGGLAAMLTSAFLSAIRGEGSPKAEDVLTIIAGLAFVAWLSWKTFSR